MGILENEEAFWERNERWKRAEALLKERKKTRDLAAISVCYALRTYHERGSSGAWLRVNAKMREFDAAEAATDAARAAERQIANEAQNDA